VGLGPRLGGGGRHQPPHPAFVEPLPLPPIKRPTPALAGPPPSVAPNHAGGEGRTAPHQAFQKYPRKFPFPPRVLFEVPPEGGRGERIARPAAADHLGLRWRLARPTFHARYGEQILVRHWNDLPPLGDNDGFGAPDVCTHLHNAHTPSESDGFPCDFYLRGQYYDHHYPNVLAGFASTHPPDGDHDEALGTLWYHDHRIDFTAQNVYKGLSACTSCGTSATAATSAPGSACRACAIPPTSTPR
jgi:hypothetical protein